MPETKKTQVEHPLKDLMEMVIGKASDSGSSLPVTIFLLAALVIGISFVGIKSALTKRKAAKAARELRKLKEEKAQAVENVQLEENAQKKDEAQKRLRVLQKKEATLANQLLDHKLKHDSYVKDLRSVTSWDDITIVDGR